MIINRRAIVSVKKFALLNGKSINGLVSLEIISLGRTFFLDRKDVTIGWYLIKACG